MSGEGIEKKGEKGLGLERGRGVREGRVKCEEEVRGVRGLSVERVKCR